MGYQPIKYRNEITSNQNLSKNRFPMRGLVGMYP